MATSTIPSAKEYAYGPIADSYAMKYGIPPEAFRDVIRKASGFDPDAAGVSSGGIANLDTRKVGFDASQVAPSLDYAARMMAESRKKTGGWIEAAKEYIGGDDTPLNDDEVKEEEDDTYSGRISAYFKKNAYTILLVLVGGLLILASLYMVIQSSSK